MQHLCLWKAGGWGNIRKHCWQNRRLNLSLNCYEAKTSYMMNIFLFWTILRKSFTPTWFFFQKPKQPSCYLSYRSAKNQTHPRDKQTSYAHVSAGKFTKRDVEKLLGSIRSMEPVIREFKIKGFNSILKRTLIVNKVGEYMLPCDLVGWHMSVGEPGLLFEGDKICNFFHIILTVFIFMLPQSPGAGFHTFTKNGDLYFTDGTKT